MANRMGSVIITSMRRAPRTQVSVIPKAEETRIKLKARQERFGKLAVFTPKEKKILKITPKTRVKPISLKRKLKIKKAKLRPLGLRGASVLTTPTQRRGLQSDPFLG